MARRVRAPSPASEAYVAGQSSENRGVAAQYLYLFPDNPPLTDPIAIL
jgi:hypothetical protein